jgi:tetratricopeptide (TPR) repeat protein
VLSAHRLSVARRAFAALLMLLLSARVAAEAGNLDRPGRLVKKGAASQGNGKRDHAIRDAPRPSGREKILALPEREAVVHLSEADVPTEAAAVQSATQTSRLSPTPDVPQHSEVISYRRACVAIEAKRREDAETALQELTRIAEQTGDALEIAVAHLMMAGVCRRQSDQLREVVAADQALEVVLRLSDRDDEVVDEVLASLFVLNYEMQRYREALDMAKRRLALLERRERKADPRLQAAWIQVAIAMEGLGDYGSAEDLFRRAIDKSVSGGALGLQAEFCLRGKLAYSILMQEKYLEAQPLYDQMLTLAASLPPTEESGENVAYVVAHYGHLLYRIGRPDYLAAIHERERKLLKQYGLANRSMTAYAPRPFPWKAYCDALGKSGPLTPLRCERLAGAFAATERNR